jgi:hypothetical protein
MDRDVTTDWMLLHIRPLCFTRYPLFYDDTPYWSQCKPYGPKNPVHTDHINLAITDVFWTCLCHVVAIKRIFGGLTRR